MPPWIGENSLSLWQELSGSSAVGPLANASQSASAASGNAVQAPQWMNPLGGLENGSSGLPSANLDATEALAAYRQQQDLTGSPSSSLSAAATYVQQVALTAQASSLATPLNLLA